MNRDRLNLSLVSFGISACTVLGSFGSMVSAFQLLSSSELTSFVIWCLLCCATLALALQFRTGLPVTLGTALVLGWFWWRGPLEQSLESLVFQISEFYQRAYGWKPLSWTDSPHGAASTMGALMALSYLMAFLVNFVISRRKTALIAIPLTLLPLLSCCVVTDTVPGWLWLFLLLFGLFVWMLTQSVRSRDLSQGNRLAAWTVIPAALCLLLVFLLNPRDSYEKQNLADRLEQWVVSAFNPQEPYVPEETKPGNIHIQLPVAGDVSGQVNLETVGPKSRQTQWVMSVTAPVNGTVYLRGCSYGSYDGSTWTAGSQPESGEVWPGSSDLIRKGTLTVQTRRIHSVVYLPCYSAQEQTIHQGKLGNTQETDSYSFDFYSLKPDYITNTSGGDWNSRYTDLPEETLAWARPLAERILGTKLPVNNVTGKEAALMAQKLAAYVRSSASYSLNTPRMPGGGDFARWFLEESDTGYCTHFATATAVLLRSAGIPARYVSGYMVSAREGRSVDVRLGDAHAWVEYRVPGSGWMVLESTPSGGDSPVETPPVTLPPLPTEEDAQPTVPGIQTDPTLTPDATQSATVPGASQENPGDKAPQNEERPSSNWWIWLLILLIPVLIVGQWLIRVNLRKQRLHSGRVNVRALTCWRETVRLSRLLGQEPPRELHSLALKAKFSQHTLTREELVQFRQYLNQSEKELRQKPLYKQLYYRLVLALY